MLHEGIFSPSNAVHSLDNSGRMVGGDTGPCTMQDQV